LTLKLPVMSIIGGIKNWGKKQSFQPNVLSVFLNPALFARWYAFKAIKKRAPLLKGTLLDFGCGRKPYRNLFLNVEKYIGLDIEVSGHPHQESEVDVYYDGKIIPFGDEYFDSVYCSEVVEHLFNLDEILLEISRVLKKDGIGLFTFPFAWQEHEVPYDFARYTSFAAKSIFEKKGFEALEIHKNGHFLITVWQLWINYIFTLFRTKNRYINTLLTIIFITPFNIIGLLVSVLPKKSELYLTNVVVVKKIW